MEKSEINVIITTYVFNLSLFRKYGEIGKIHEISVFEKENYDVLFNKEKMKKLIEKGTTYTSCNGCICCGLISFLNKSQNEILDSDLWYNNLNKTDINKNIKNLLEQDLHYSMFLKMLPGNYKITFEYTTSKFDKLYKVLMKQHVEFDGDSFSDTVDWNNNEVIESIIKNL